ARVAVCSNGLFTGDFVLKNRHSRKVVLEDLVAEGVERWLASTNEVEQFVKVLRETPLDNKDAAYIVAKAGTQLRFGGAQLMAWEKGNFIMQHWLKPPYQEFEGRTAWS